MAQTLPIFPLNTVLFPGAPLPLRIFEPRYREMLARCMEDDRRFGVTLVKSGLEVGGAAEPHDVGTVARIGRVHDEDRGAIPIDTVGEERFRIISLHRGQSYLVGEVEFLGDSLDAAAGPAADTARAAAEGYVRMLLTVQGEWRDVPALPVDPLVLSYFLGTMMIALPATVRQEVLEANPVSGRLDLAGRAIQAASDELRSAVMRAGPGPDRTVFGIN